MKNLLLTLAMFGLTYTAAEAQSSANSKFAKNYRVCLVGDKYQVCNENTPIATNLGRTTETATSFGMQNTYVHMGYSTGGNARYRSRIRVTYDEPGAAYEGKESMINDGVRKNEQRNLNTNNGAYDLPPNDGGLSNR